MKLTHRQISALKVLRGRHEAYPDYAQFGTIHLGENTTAILRRLVPHGFVSSTKGGPGTRQFFAITEAGRAALREETK